MFPLDDLIWINPKPDINGFHDVSREPVKGWTAFVRLVKEAEKEKVK